MTITTPQPARRDSNYITDTEIEANTKASIEADADPDTETNTEIETKTKTDQTNYLLPAQELQKLELLQAGQKKELIIDVKDIVN